VKLLYICFLEWVALGCVHFKASCNDCMAQCFTIFSLKRNPLQQCWFLRMLTEPTGIARNLSCILDALGDQKTHLTASKSRLVPVSIEVARSCSDKVSDSRSVDYGFDSRPRHCRTTTLGKLFTPMCLCLPSSISWYLARAFMSTRRLWQPWHEVQWVL